MTSRTRFPKWRAAHVLATLSTLSAILLVNGVEGADLRGRITVYGTQPVAEAIVRVRENSGRHRVLITETNSQGAYIIRDLPEGRHSLEVERNGKTFRQTVVVQSPQTDKNINLY